MSDQMRYSLTFGGRNSRHLMYTGVMVTPSLQDYAEYLIFEESGLAAAPNGDKQYRDRDNYHVAIFTGRGSYLVILSYNLGLEPRAPGADSKHLGYLMLDVKMLGASLSEAMLAAARLIQDLTQSTAFIPIDAEDRERFYAAQVKHAADKNVPVMWSLGNLAKDRWKMFKTKVGAEHYLASMKASKPFSTFEPEKLEQLIADITLIEPVSRDKADQLRTAILTKMKAQMAEAKDEPDQWRVQHEMMKVLGGLENPLPDDAKFEGIY